jgi:hypothetical protein
MSSRRVVDEDPESLAAQLVRAGRAVTPPDSLTKHTLSRLGLGAAMAGTGAAHAGTAGSAVAAIAKWVGISGALGLSAIGVVQHSSTRSEPPERAPVARPVASAAARAPDASEGTSPAPVASVPALEQAAPLSSTPSSGTRRPVAPVPSAARPSRGESLANEVALIDQVRTELSLKQPERALQSLREHARRFSAPRLAEEALFLRTQALSQLGRSREANEELERFRRAYPGSVLPDPR